VEAGPITLHCNSRDKNAAQNFPSNYIRTTKYTLLSFFPMNMVEQFQKASNIFFLANMIVALIPGVSPVFPATTILPLIVVVGVASLRDAFEDYQRYKADQRANALEVQIIDSSGKIVVLPSRDVQVGDVLFLERGAEIPVDCFILSTQLQDGACFVETANLDGETNLKPKQSKQSLHKAFGNPHAITSFSGMIVCDAPNNSLHKWQGKIVVPNFPEQSIDMDNLLLRGCTVRNVDWVIAVTIYTGIHTKLFLNLTQKPPKISRLDRKLNRLILMILLVQQILMIIICSLHIGWRNSSAAKGFYVAPLVADYNDGTSWIRQYLTYFILLSLMMPISLFVSLEFCKAAQAKLMEWDEQLTNKADRMRARTSSLNEELSQVQYIFSDKTGTLTDNQMRFAMAFAGGQQFNEMEAPGSLKKYVTQTPNAPQASRDEVSNFLRLLSLCNAVVINIKGDDVVYDGSSTDEVALVSTANKNGARLLARTSDSMTIDIQQHISTVEVVAILPFTAERKMMSVVIRERDGTIRMYTKGADSSVMARTSPSNNLSIIKQAQRFLDDCAGLGLRTLVCAERFLSPAEFESWKVKWDRATLNTTSDRDALVHEAALAAENQLQLVGCTAIEDRLQDEVPETIHFLLRCGIVVWVLTGDKRETALNIAGTSKLLDHKADLIIQIDLEETPDAAKFIEDAIDQVSEAKKIGQKASFIVDGKSLERILQAETFERFRQLGLMVNSAVCCRVTPLQKASVVAMFQELGSTCLGVGDGANDVSMIQEARVGIGILGLEGSQAERAADYAIPRFRHLRRLLAIHGRYSLIRNSQLVQYSFYKNIVYSLTQVFYSFYNAYSGQTIYDSWVIVFFNMAFTFFPPMVMGILDYDVRDSYLSKHPKLYAELRSPFAIRMSRASSLVWMMLALFHAWVIFYGTYRSATVDDHVTQGRNAGLWASGTVMMNTLLAVVSCQAALTFLSWTWFHFLSIAVSFVLYTAFLFVYAAMPPSLNVADYYEVPNEVYDTAVNWLTILLWTLAIMGPQVAVIVIRRNYFSIDMHVARAGDHVLRKSLPWESVPMPPPPPPPISTTPHIEQRLLSHEDDI
jgi:phospholipid-transporting ATPase